MIFLSLFGKRDNYYQAIKEFINSNFEDTDPVYILISLFIKLDIKDSILNELNPGETLSLIFNFLNSLDAFIVNNFLYWLGTILFKNDPEIGLSLIMISGKEEIA